MADETERSGKSRAPNPPGLMKPSATAKAVSCETVSATAENAKAKSATAAIVVFLIILSPPTNFPYIQHSVNYTKFQPKMPVAIR